ncbi:MULTISPECIES: RNA polymerase sigma factor [Listeria]|uniref:RNA polymerase sigma factor n=1 Tax=Listeria TaxID=1637 RepID=UPI000B597C71|nr:MULTISPECIES: sigma factor-like helix-turn-helix DNA-binding protein [Listeria]
MLNQKHRVHKQHTFDAYCKKVLKNEVRNIYKELERKRQRETSLSLVSPSELFKLGFIKKDELFMSDKLIVVQECEVIIKSEVIRNGILELPETFRQVVIYYYFLGMSDYEIAEKLGMVRRTVSRWRNQALSLLQLYFEGKCL